MQKLSDKIPSIWKYILSALFFPLGLFFQEMVFHQAVFLHQSFLSVVITFLFSFCMGLILYLPTYLIKKALVAKIVTGILLGLIALTFCVEFFIVQQFQTLFDLGTITLGAGEAAADFTGTALRLITSRTGLWHIFLFLLPLILYFVISKYFMKSGFGTLKLKTAVLAGFLILFLAADSAAAAGVVIHKNDQLKKAYRTEYTFAKSTDSFGLMTGIRLDLIRPKEERISDLTWEAEDWEDWPEEELPEEELEEGSASAEMAESSSPSEETLPADEMIAEADPSASESAAANGSEEETADAEASADSSADTEEDEVIEEAETPSLLPETWEVKPAQLDLDFEALSEAAPSSSIAAMDAYASSLRPSNTNAFTGLFKGKNLILICAEAFCSHAIDEKLTPTLYRMATKGINILDYTQPYNAGTTGGECCYLMGVLPIDGAQSMQEIVNHNNYYTIGSFLDREGYYGQAFHNHRYTYYNRNITHQHLGYSEGFIGYGSGLESFITSAWPESDVEMFEGTIPMYIDKQPFNIYYMTVSGHSEYDVNQNDQSKKHWDRVKDLPYSYAVQCYYAANLELEDSMTLLIKELEKKGIADDTVIVISGDHFPYGLSWYDALGYKKDLDELYGFNVRTYMERDQNQLIIWSGCLEDYDPVVVSEPVCSIDVLPTLLNLFGCEWDSRLLPGRDIFSKKLAIAFDAYGDWKTTEGEFNAFTNQFTPYDENMFDPEGYKKRINATVSNKLKQCAVILQTDYFEHIFPSRTEE
ncbi:MAG: sulfatase-like hydrolase/transferase [Firmicutes bacterium]|nr:sulfatase-like hydrolase/transferase [Bacillota bacterium]